MSSHTAAKANPIHTNVKKSATAFSRAVLDTVSKKDAVQYIAHLITEGLHDLKDYATLVYPKSGREKDKAFGNWVFSETIRYDATISLSFPPDVLHYGPWSLVQSFQSHTVGPLTFLRPYALHILRLACLEIESLHVAISAICASIVGKNNSPDYVLHSACFSLLGASCFGKDPSGEISAHWWKYISILSDTMLKSIQKKSLSTSFWSQVESYAHDQNFSNH